MSSPVVMDLTCPGKCQADKKTVHVSSDSEGLALIYCLRLPRPGPDRSFDRVHHFTEPTDTRIHRETTKGKSNQLWE